MKQLLIVGSGDVAQRMIPRLRGRCGIYALTRDPRRCAFLRAPGVTPIRGDFDAPAGLARDVVHFAPPPDRGVRDTRTTHLIAALARGSSLPQQLVCISTGSACGERSGGLVPETRRPRPQTGRAGRRADAERQLREWGKRSGVRVAILRVPGIHAAHQQGIAAAPASAGGAPRGERLWTK